MLLFNGSIDIILRYVWKSKSFEVAKPVMKTKTDVNWLQFSSVQLSHSVVSDSLRPHESQHARPPCPSPTPGVHSDLRPLSQWCHPAISSSVVPISSCPQSLPASESFPMSQLFAWGGQSTGVSALAAHYQRNANQNSNKVSSGMSQNGQHQEVKLCWVFSVNKFEQL